MARDWKYDTIEIIDDTMCVMDRDGNGLDAHVFSTRRAATRQIQEWANQYTINIADAYRKLDDVDFDHFRSRPRTLGRTEVIRHLGPAALREIAIDLEVADRSRNEDLFLDRVMAAWTAIVGAEEVGREMRRAIDSRSTFPR